jgi:hypothetical protein
LKFLNKVWVGRACAGANQQELTTCAKKWGQEEEIIFVQGEVRAPNYAQQATVGRQPARALLGCQTNNLQIIIF